MILPKSIIKVFGVAFLVVTMPVFADEVEQKAVEKADDAGFGYREPIPNAFKFTDAGLDMVKAEREEYAKNLAATANLMLTEHARVDGEELLVDSQKAKPLLPLIDRLMGLSLQLAPRMRAPVVINHQFRKGMVAKHYKPEIASHSLASLMQMRAIQLLDNGGAENELLAGCFLDLSVALDPQNEDAIFSLEILRMDKKTADWRPIWAK